MKRKLMALTAIFFLAGLGGLAGTTTAQASNGVRGITKHDRQVIGFFKHHPKLAATPQGGKVLARILPHVIRSLQIAVEEKIAEEKARVTQELIKHEALWRCIAGYPGARPGGGTGESGGDPGASNGSHFNILQMTDPWGSDNFHPIGQSPETVMIEAENAYKASGYSQSWLWSQWGQTLSPCIQFA